MTDPPETILAGAWRRDSHLHGEEHWRAVATTGLELVAAGTGGDAEVVWWFGWLHDTRRENDGWDTEHGHRAALFARELRAEGLIRLNDDRLELLCYAIELHAAGQVSNDETVGTCWDADRLHLTRIGVRVNPTLLSTAQARDRV